MKSITLRILTLTLLLGCCWSFGLAQSLRDDAQTTRPHAAGANENEASNTKEKVERPSFAAKLTYKCVLAEAFVRNGVSATSEELAKENQSVQRNVSALLQKGDANSLRLFVTGDFDMRAVETLKADGSVLWTIKSSDCETCHRTMFLRLVENSKEYLTYETDSEDEGSPFAFRLRFKMIPNN